jgi:hypothetical protein
MVRKAILAVVAALTARGILQQDFCLAAAATMTRCATGGAFSQTLAKQGRRLELETILVSKPPINGSDARH